MTYALATGHLGAADPLAGFNDLVQSRQLQPGDRVLVIARGGGFVAAVAAIEIIDRSPLGTTNP